ncbi:hypothetical protein Goshw_023720 [Gossypium schwendimanii]|uniref:Uncharacterized protein n=1 Tax=Gossypium schwendimanii TaxID=34291 RepID=A0A7J9MEE5_GOSSC|nr:hypothetical protein [Gossypium schwendimanii]
MAQRLVYGVLKLSSIFYFVVCHHSRQEVAQAIIRSAIDFKRDPWPKVLDNAKDLVKKMLNLDPKTFMATKCQESTQCSIR